MDATRLDFAVPIELDPSRHTAEQLSELLYKMHKSGGFTRFAFFTPSKGWRSVGYPPRDHYIECATLFGRTREAVRKYGIECGWFLALTLKSGPSPDFTAILRPDGSEHPFASCPLDPVFKKRYCEDIALFCKIARPDFIFTEDDFSLCAAGGGCYCKHHLGEFARRVGRAYSREELTERFARKNPEDIELLREWRRLLRDSLVDFAKAVRKEVDKENPEIPIGSMQSGCADDDGDTTEAIARALAGEKHTPFSRIYGTFYSGMEAKRLPEEMFHALYSKQHIGDNFRFYHETDGYPHSRFYTAAKHLDVLMGTAFSYGFDGSLYFCRHFFEDGEGEPLYGRLHAREINRYQRVSDLAKRCEIKGVGIEYDPFTSTVDRDYPDTMPLWVKCISRFGIPYTSLDSPVTLWDSRQAKYSSDGRILEKLSGCLILDGDAAAVLCERGYGRYLGAEAGGTVGEGTTLCFDLGACEVILDGVLQGLSGIIPGANAYAPCGSGVWRRLSVTDERCTVLTEAKNFRGEVLSPAMTVYENSLGGKVAIMSLTLCGNNSHALYHHNRQRILRELINSLCPDFVTAIDSPDLFITVNEAKDGEDFIGMITLVTLCEDGEEKIRLRLPEKWRSKSEILTIEPDGSLAPLSFSETDEVVEIAKELCYCEPAYLVVK